jgi:hypothetical protein
MTTTLEIMRTGPLALVEDMGRPVWRTWASPAPARPIADRMRWPTGWWPTPPTAPRSK